MYVNQATNQILKDESIHNVNYSEELNNSIIKKSFSNGLERKSEDELERPSKIINTLPLLNSEEVSDCFTTDLMSIVPDDERVGKFCDYLVDYYIDKGQNSIHAFGQLTLLARLETMCPTYKITFPSR
ncbi:MULE domain-containing protein, partial [Aphis craccivora]